METMEVEVKRKVSMLERIDLNKKGANIIEFFVASFRESEVFTMDAEGFCHQN